MLVSFENYFCKWEEILPQKTVCQYRFIFPQMEYRTEKECWNVLCIFSMSEGLPTFRLISSIEMEKIISVLAWLAGRCFSDLLRLCWTGSTGSTGSTGRDTCMSAHTRTVRMGGSKGSTAWPEGLPPVESLSLGLPDWGSGSGPRLVRLRTEGCQCEGGVEPGSYCPRLVGTTGVLWGGQEWSPVHSQHRAE